MSNLEVQKPKNVTKRTAIGCLLIGLFLFFVSLCIFIIGLIFRFKNTYIAFGATLLAFGIIAILAGGVGFFRGKAVDELISGKDLLAQWNYLVDEKGNRKSGYIYIGTKGFYKDGLYISWSDKCVLKDISFQEGAPATITFHYIRRNYNQDAGGWSSLENNFPVPVPPDKKEDAMRVISYYQKSLRKSDERDAN